MPGSNYRILYVAAHPDDELFSAGGMLAKHRLAGHDVWIIYLTSGDNADHRVARDAMATIREKEAQSAAKVLGIKAHQLIFMREMLGTEDGYLTDSQPVISYLVSLIRRLRPQVMYLPWSADEHHDHQLAHQIMIRAAAHATGPHFPDNPGEPWRIDTILGGEIWGVIPQPPLVFDVTDVFESVQKALDCHASQNDRFPYASLLVSSHWRTAARRLGRSEGYAEAFEAVAIGPSIAAVYEAAETVQAH